MLQIHEDKVNCPGPSPPAMSKITNVNTQVFIFTPFIQNYINICKYSYIKGMFLFINIGSNCIYGRISHMNII